MAMMLIDASIAVVNLAVGVLSLRAHHFLVGVLELCITLLAIQCLLLLWERYDG